MHTITRFPIYALLLAALLFQLVLAPHVRLFGAEPDMITLFVIFFAIFLGADRGFEVGVAAGFLKDVFALDIFGINMLVLGATGLLAGVVNTRFLRESRLSDFLLVFLFTVFSMACHFSVSGLLIRSSAMRLGEYLFASAIPVGLYTGLISIPIFAKCIEAFALQSTEDLL